MIFHYPNKFGNVRITSLLITSESLNLAEKCVGHKSIYFSLKISRIYFRFYSINKYRFTLLIHVDSTGKEQVKWVKSKNIS